MDDQEKLGRCSGCRDDFYNNKSPGGEKRCWSFETAKVVRRFETGTWTDPTKPGAFTEVEVHDCFNASGRHFTDKLPACAVDPVLIRRAGDERTLWVDDVKPPARRGCVVARTYDEALSKLRAEPWDVLYLDYDLGAPGCNGVALLQEMAEFDIPIPPVVRPISSSDLMNVVILDTLARIRGGVAHWQPRSSRRAAGGPTSHD